MNKSLKTKVKELLPENSSPELIKSVYEFVQSREKLAFVSARIPATPFGLKFNQPTIMYHYRDVTQYLNTPE